MRKIRICDMTLGAAKELLPEAPSYISKIKTAKLLDTLNLDVIEAAPILDGKVDVLFLHNISSIIENSVLSCPAGLTESSVEEAYNAVKGAKKPRLSIRIPVSTVQMEYLCRMKGAKVLDLIAKLCAKASSLCKDVEVVLLDSTRAEKDFLISAVKCSTENGATVVCLGDNAGDMLPEEFGEYISEMKNSGAFDGALLSVQCSGENDMAAAYAAAAIRSGAEEIKVSAFEGYSATLLSTAKLLRHHADKIGVESALDITKAEKACGKIGSYYSAKADAATPYTASTGSALGEEELLDSDTSLEAFARKVSQMGYALSGDDLQNVYAEFRIMSEKKSVSTKELDTIIATTAMEVPATYKLVNYVINSGDIITPTANIEMLYKGKPVRGLSIGDGPIDAAFLAIENVVGHKYELDDFRIQAITGGYDAMGHCLVKLRSDGILYSGSGSSTDIIGACIKAYLNALNKICYEEGNA